MTTFLNDLQYALRRLRKTPGFSLVCVLTLALGIGANTAVFSVMNTVLLKSLPVADPDRVVYLNTSGAPARAGTVDSHETFPYSVYDELRHYPRALSQVIAYVPLATEKVAVRSGAQPEEAEGDMVSGAFFSGLGIKLTRGRGFTEHDESTHAPVVVISYNYWSRRFARDPNILGEALYVKGIAFSVVGVATEGFEGVEPGYSTDFWIPLQSRPELNAWGNPTEFGKTYIENPRWWCLRLLGRLAPGVSGGQAAVQLQTAFQTAAYVGLGGPEPGEARPTLSLHEAKNFPGYDEQYGKPLRVLMGMVGLVLLIALSNVAMLLLARNATRRREFSLRLATRRETQPAISSIADRKRVAGDRRRRASVDVRRLCDACPGSLGKNRIEPGARSYRASVCVGHSSSSSAVIWIGATTRRTSCRPGTGVEDIAGDLES